MVKSHTAFLFHNANFSASMLLLSIDISSENILISNHVCILSFNEYLLSTFYEMLN